jgi:hypothetical protein
MKAKEGLKQLRYENLDKYRTIATAESNLKYKRLELKWLLRGSLKSEELYLGWHGFMQDPFG